MPSSRAQTLEQHIAAAERAGIGMLVPGDKDWPSALDDLGDRRSYVLWTRGMTSFLARPVDDRVTITGARAATSYGEHVAAESASELTSAERIVVAGGAYGIEGGCPPSGPRTKQRYDRGHGERRDRTYLMGHRELLERVADLGPWPARFRQTQFRSAIASSLGCG